jgi:glycosyltransferase involved in cell wall biosynthesis
MQRRLSVCYAAPGHALVPTSGTSRNLLSLAGALSRWADVTVAFRTLPKELPDVDAPVRIVAIEDGSAGNPGVDDEATRGVNPFAHFAYLRAVRKFARSQAHEFDLVLEKGWRLSGFLLSSFGDPELRGAVIENDARCWTDSGRDLRTLLKWLLHLGAQRAAGYYSGRAPLVIAETEELREQLFQVRRIPREKIAVVPLGVDHGIFRPLNQAEEREALSIPLDRMVILYVGGMDKYHDLHPLLDALSNPSVADLELHVVGEGEYRDRYREKAALAKAKVVFHGRVPHAHVPRYIAAADLCLAPYCSEAFFGGVVTFSTLKIPEYMACGRPVASVPSGEIGRLIENGTTGFLFPNSVAGWRNFLDTLPSRDRLCRMGLEARKAVSGRSWEQTALRYLQACLRAHRSVECGWPGVPADDTVPGSPGLSEGFNGAEHRVAETVSVADKRPKGVSKGGMRR